MKIVLKLGLIAIFFTALISSTKLRGPLDKPAPTPKASDLNDHFGTDPARGIYGPKPAALEVKLMREGITGKDTPITPITNFNKEINPVQVVSGELDNTSYDASKIIKPVIAGKIFLIFFIFS